MLKFQSNIDNCFAENLRHKLNIGKIDSMVLNETAGYFFTMLKMLDGFRQAYLMWLDDSVKTSVDTKEFFAGIHNMFSLFRKAKDRADGITGLYISRLELPEIQTDNKNYQPWCFSGQSNIYSPVRGIFKKLTEAGLNQDTIDRYYIDGALLEVYEICMEVLPALLNLIETDNPNPREVQEGLFVVETHIQKIYDKLFIERFDDLQGLNNVIKFALVKMK